MKPGRFTIIGDGKSFEIVDPKTRETTGPLTVGEALEQIIWLFQPSRPPFPMKTKREWSRKQRARRSDFSETTQRIKEVKS